MNSRVKLGVLVFGLAAISAPLKFIEPDNVSGNVQTALAVTEEFLSTVSDTPPEEVDLFTSETQWIGRRFSLRGCEATAYPSPADGWLLQSVQARANPSDRISLIFEGERRETPPVVGYARNVIADRLLVPFGIIDRPDRFMLILVAPEECADGVEALNWPKSLQPA